MGVHPMWLLWVPGLCGLGREPSVFTLSGSHRSSWEAMAAKNTLTEDSGRPGVEGYLHPGILYGHRRRRQPLKWQISYYYQPWLNWAWEENAISYSLSVMKKPKPVRILMFSSSHTESIWKLADREMYISPVAVVSYSHSEGRYFKEQRSN